VGVAVAFLGGVVTAIVAELRFIEGGVAQTAALSATGIFIVMGFVYLGRFSGMLGAGSSERLLTAALAKGGSPGRSGDDQTKKPAAAPALEEGKPAKKLPKGQKPRAPAGRKKPQKP